MPLKIHTKINAEAFLLPFSTVDFFSCDSPFDMEKAIIALHLPFLVHTNSIFLASHART